MSDTDKRSVDLYRDSGPTSRTVYATIDDNGQFIVSGLDVGDAPNEVWGDDDYEFWVSVKPEDKPAAARVLATVLFGGLNSQDAQDFFSEARIGARDHDARLLALIERKYKDRMHAVDEFRVLMNEHNVPNAFGSWV